MTCCTSIVSRLLVSSLEFLEFEFALEFLEIEFALWPLDGSISWTQDRSTELWRQLLLGRFQLTISWAFGELVTRAPYLDKIK